MRFFYLLFTVFLVASHSASAQSDPSNSGEAHRVWKKWSRKKNNYNPYLDRKRKDKPSARMARQNQKDVKRQQKEAKKQMRKSRKSISRANRRRLKGK